MIPKIADLKPAQATAADKAAAKALFEAKVGRQIKNAAKAGRTRAMITGLKEYPEVREKLLAEGYTLTLWRDTTTTMVSWA